MEGWSTNGCLTAPPPPLKHGKPGIAFTVHCFRIRVSTLLLRCLLLVKKKEREKDSMVKATRRRRSVTLDRRFQTYRHKRNILNRWLHEERICLTNRGFGTFPCLLVRKHFNEVAAYRQRFIDDALRELFIAAPGTHNIEHLLVYDRRHW